MSSPDTACVKFTTAKYSIGDYAVGDEDIHDSQITRVERLGSDVVVTLESAGWKRPQGTLFQLVFKDATSILEQSPIERFLYRLSDSTDEAGLRTYYFAAEDDEPCLNIEAASLTVSG